MCKTGMGQWWGWRKSGGCTVYVGKLKADVPSGTGG